MAHFLSCLSSLLLISMFIVNAVEDPNLSLNYYASSCPAVFDIVRKEMECEVLSDPRNAALVVRLHFHDCFVQGCDGSVLLDDTVSLKGEKKASTMKGLKGFKLIDKIKNKVESECPGIVSCADLLTIAARDAIILVGGPYWDVPVGRKDSKSASYELAESNIPVANEGLVSIISKFLYHGLSVTDMVALSGSHTIGMARCENYRARIYGDWETTSDITTPNSATYLKQLRASCPAGGGGDNNVSAMDYSTPNLFDNSYFQILLRGQGLLNSDQQLYSSILGIQTKNIVVKYAHEPIAFFQQFSESMVKLGNITNADSFVNGEVRRNCRFINT